MFAFLFSFDVDSFLTWTSKLSFACRLRINSLNIQAYADDIALFCPTDSGLQRLLDHLSATVDEHDLQTNVSKTKFMIFKGQRTQSLRNFNFRITGCIIDEVLIYKY